MKNIQILKITIIALLFMPFALMANSNKASDVKTLNNLYDAFKGESTASAKYAAYAAKAKEEGHNKIALLFEAASKAENIHAGNHKAVIKQMGGELPEVKPEFTVNSTRENLLDAIKGETYEVTDMYPAFLKISTGESANLATISFNYAYQTEKKHKAFYEEALKALDNKNETTLASQFYVCPTCGNTYEGTAPERCGISMTSGDRFIMLTL